MIGHKTAFNAPDRAKAGLTPEYYENMQGKPTEKEAKKSLKNAVGGG